MLVGGEEWGKGRLVHSQYPVLATSVMSEVVRIHNSWKNEIYMPATKHPLAATNIFQVLEIESCVGRRKLN